MKIELESTPKMATLNGVPARVWQGKTASGTPVYAFITRVAVSEDESCAEFERELEEQAVPRPEGMAIDVRLLL